MMAEYPVKSTSQGTYGRIEQRSEVKRETYKMCRAGGGARGLELKTAVLDHVSGTPTIFPVLKLAKVDSDTP